MHTQASRLYRTKRIKGHVMQVHASMAVLVYLTKRYPTARRHEQRVCTALQRMARSHAG